jgi:hypothetical protein
LSGLLADDFAECGRLETLGVVAGIQEELERQFQLFMGLVMIPFHG